MQTHSPKEAMMPKSLKYAMIALAAGAALVFLALLNHFYVM